MKGTAVTMKNTIYFPNKINLKKKDDLMWLLHEIQHVNQYAQFGLSRFYTSYFTQTIIETLSHSSFDIHDYIPLEKDADSVMYKVIKRIWRKKVLACLNCK